MSLGYLIRFQSTTNTLSWEMDIYRLSTEYLNFSVEFFREPHLSKDMAHEVGVMVSIVSPREGMSTLQSNVICSRHSLETC